MAKIKLTQISVISILALLFITSAILSLFWQRDAFFYLQRKLAEEPNKADYYSQTATILLNNNQFKEAEYLLKLGETHQAASPDLWQQKHLEDPRDVNILINRWQQVTNERPDYRDAYLQLAFLYLKLQNHQEAYLATQKALKIDPYFVPAQEMQTLLDNSRRN